MRTVGLRPMTAHLRSVILIGPLAFAASGGFIAAALALPPNMVAPAIPERDPTNPLRVHFAISLPPSFVSFVDEFYGVLWTDGPDTLTKGAAAVSSTKARA